MNMWVTSGEKSEVSKRAYDFEKNRISDIWYVREQYYRDRDPYIEQKVRVADNILYIVREMLKDLPFDVHLPEAKEYINIRTVKERLYQNGVPEIFMPADMYIDMFLTTAIPSFLHRKKNYPVNDEADESMPIIFYDDPKDPENGKDKYAIICGEACVYSRDYKGFSIYVSGYIWHSYVLSDVYDGYWCKKCRYFGVGDNLTLIKGADLATTKERVAKYLRGEPLE